VVKLPIYLQQDFSAVFSTRHRDRLNSVYASCLLLKPFTAFTELLEFRLESVDVVEIFVAEIDLFLQIAV